MLIFIAVLSAFAIIGVVAVIKELIYDNVHTREITVYTLNNENDIEYVLRSLRNSFPRSDISIRDLGSQDMTLEIAKKLEHEP